MRGDRSCSRLAVFYFSVLVVVISVQSVAYLIVFCRGLDHHDDDFIFEDFARLRLTGHAIDDTEA